MKPTTLPAAAALAALALTGCASPTAPQDTEAAATAPATPHQHQQAR